MVPLISGYAIDFDGINEDENLSIDEMISREREMGKLNIITSVADESST